jgi:hypothetical protein
MGESERKRIFIAAVSPGMTDFKENLIKELENTGYDIGQIGDHTNEIERIPEIIEDYDLAIHILSDRDEIRTQNGKGIEEQQVLFTVQHYLGSKLVANTQEEIFKIYAWHPKSRTENIFQEENLPIHLRKIQQFEEIEFLRTNFEDFKYYLIKNLEAEESTISDEQHFIKGHNNQSIYFLYDKVDKNSAKEFLNYLKKRGYTVFSPKLEGDILSIRKMHTQSLKNFDLAIIFADKVSANWVNMKIMDILKSPGLGREKDILGKAIMMAESKLKMCPLANRGFDFLPFDEKSSISQIDVFLNKNLP